jgi:hypothetical protein
MQERQFFIQYFPDPKERCKLQRQFYINVLNSVASENFRSFIYQKLDEKNHK